METTNNSTKKMVRRRSRRRRSSCECCCDVKDNADNAAAKDKEVTVRRKRRRAPSLKSSSSATTPLLFLAFILYQQQQEQQQQHGVNGAVIVWTNGPEDKYFCGTSWNIPSNCSFRQHCKSGRDDECEGHSLDQSIQCFSNTICDVKQGGAAAWVSNMGYDALYKSSAPSRAPIVVDFDTLLEGGLFTPSASPITPGGPTPFPTEVPIGPPPPLDYPSDNWSDHWYCGVGIDNANSKCETHCPNSSECPLGEICYFGTACDARTHTPTPPPTRRPTASPTTGEPTITLEPTGYPTISREPTEFPTERGATDIPTVRPAGVPTSTPLTEVQGGFFCGTSWSDVTSGCKKRCVSGEDTDCPGIETCFAFTGCTEVRGYGSDPSKWIPGYNEWGVSIADIVNTMEQTEAQSFANGNGNNNAKEEEVPLCYDTVITITADNWPQETTWNIADVETDNVVITGNNADLVPNTPFVSEHCLPSWACYKFTINDAGGDGLCCEHGEGMYQIKYDGEVIANGAAFYDSESVEFGCVETPEPTPGPTRKPTPQPNNVQTNNAESSGGGGGSSLHRCVANDLAEAGYLVKEQFCDKFVDCYNQYIETGDDWFCNDDEVCIEADACGDVAGVAPESPAEAPVEDEAEETVPKPQPPPTPSKPGPNSASKLESSAEVASVGAPPTTDKPTPKPTAATPKPIDAPITAAPSAIPTSMSPTESPTEIPTLSPTLGPCGGERCPNSSHCRSNFGFCGPDEHYCKETSIWTSDCPEKVPTRSPIAPTASPSEFPVSTQALGDVFGIASGGSSAEDDGVGTPQPIESAATVAAPNPAENAVGAVNTPNPTVTLPNPFPAVVFQKPGGGGKPKPAGGKGGGGKGPVSASASKPTKPAIPVFQTKPPVTTSQPTSMPTTKKPTSLPTSTPTTSKPTRQLTVPAKTEGGQDVFDYSNLPADSSNQNGNAYVNLSTHSSDLVIITNAPTAKPSNVASAAADINKCPKGTSSVQRSDCNPSTTTTTTTSNTVEEINEYICTNEPCQVETWCRSRYGSCGPGFIYCNSYSTWTNDCPAVVPGTRPTRTPTSKPTREPIVYTIAAIPKPSSSLGGEQPAAPSVVEFPTLPRPTLPTITKGGESSATSGFVNQSMGAHSNPLLDRDQVTSEDSFETSESKRKNNDEDDGDDDEEEGEPKEKDNNPKSMSYVGMNEWLDYTGNKRSGVTSIYSTFGSNHMFGVIISSLWMFIQ